MGEMMSRIKMSTATIWPIKSRQYLTRIRIAAGTIEDCGFLFRIGCDRSLTHMVCPIWLEIDYSPRYTIDAKSSGTFTDISAVLNIVIFCSHSVGPMHRRRYEATKNIDFFYAARP